MFVVFTPGRAMDHASGVRAYRPRLAGFDLLRLVAAGTIFYQHACSLLGREDLVEVLGLRVGRVGTATFFALSGYLAATSSRSPESWLGRRLMKLFPAYWVVTALTFAATALTGYKQFDTIQVVCQLAGIGLYTHGEMLVGVSTWFVSALLVLYLIAYLGLRTEGLAVVVATLLLGVVAVIDPAGLESFTIVSTHGVTFLLAYTVGKSGRPAGSRFLFWALVLAAGGMYWPQFRYGAVALGGLAVVTACTRDCGFGRWFATYSYEWFLVHGLCLHVVIALGADRLALLLPCAAVVSLASAVLLKGFVETLVARVNSLAGWQGNDEDGSRSLALARSADRAVASQPRLPHVTNSW